MRTILADRPGDGQYYRESRGLRTQTLVHERWPNFLLVGAMKAGTTSIANALAVHPDIFISPVKEPNYFCTDLVFDEEDLQENIEIDTCGDTDGKLRVHAGLYRHKSDYLSLFQDWNHQKIGTECSTSYLYSTVAAENISQVSPHAKILIVLRNPVERAFSEFLMNCSIGVAMPPFSKYLDLERAERERGQISRHHKYVTAGLYFKQIKKYLEHFPARQVLIMLYDDLERDFNGFMTRVFNFLDVEELPYTGNNRSNGAQYPRWAHINMLLKRTGMKRLLKGIMPRDIKSYCKKMYYQRPPANVTLDAADRRRLVNEFAVEVSRLSMLLKRDLSGWLA